MRLGTLLFSAILFASTSCQVKSSTERELPVEGTWQLISETKIEGQDTSFSVVPDNIRNVKMLNKTHFSFLRHDLNGGKDSTNAVFVAGGGTYRLEGDKYSEHLEFCNYREWENHDFDFTVIISNDTLVQQGREKIDGVADRIIIEKYVRVTH